MHYGDLGKRIVAFIYDGFILSFVYSIVFYVYAYLTYWPFGYFWYNWYKWVPFVSIVFPLISLFYFMLMEGGGWHATVGKKIMGLYVGDAHGRGINYSVAILRYIGRILSSLMLGIGYIMGFFDSRKQCLHDMLAKTYVYTEIPHGHVYNGNPVYGTAGYNAYGGQPQLIGVSGSLAGVAYPVTSGGLLIGRDPVSCQVVIPSAQTKVSRTHCYLTYNAVSGMFVLNDRNSSGGTFLANGKRVYYGQPAALRRGDRFYLATVNTMFEVR